MAPRRNIFRLFSSNPKSIAFTKAQVEQDLLKVDEHDVNNSMLVRT
jgi:hypothetical protein